MTSVDDTSNEVTCYMVSSNCDGEGQIRRRRGGCGHRLTAHNRDAQARRLTPPPPPPRHAVTAPFEPETPEVFTAAELAQRFGQVSRRDAERARKLKLLVPLGGGRFEAPSPALLNAAEEVMALGIPMHAALELVERVIR